MINFCEEVMKKTHPKLAGDTVESLVEFPRYRIMEGVEKYKERLGEFKSSLEEKFKDLVE